jgi:Fe-S cluster biogenesis protein NfuA
LIAEGSIELSEQTKVDLRKRVDEVMDIIRPNLQADGGDVEVVDVTDDGVVQVRLQGACHGCPMAAMTLQMGIERVLRKEIPEVTGVENMPHDD